MNSIEGEVRKILEDTGTIDIDKAEKEILKLTNLRPLSEKEVEKIIREYMHSKVECHKTCKYYKKNCIKKSVKCLTDIMYPEDLAHIICSHFSKPQIKLPAKMKQSEIVPVTDLDYNMKCYYYNQAISDMRKLNGEDV